MKSDARILELPQPIIDRLREVIGRVRRLQWIKGSLFTLAAAVAAILAVMALDAAFALESLPLRLALSLAGLAFTGWVAWTQWLRPLCRRISLTAVARWVENRHPELQERISTAVELLDARHGSDDQGSRELLEAVVQDAVADVSKVDPNAELSARRTLPAKWLAGSAVAVLALLAAVWPNQVPRLLARALAPMADVGNAWAGRLRVLTGDQTVAIGDPLGIEVAVRSSRDRVELHLTAPDGRTTVEMLSPDAGVALQAGETGYALRLPSVAESFTARVVAGKAVSAAFTIKAVPRPDTGELTLSYDYPEYTGMADEVKTGASGEIIAVAGTRVTVQALLNRAVSKASVKIGELDVPGVRLGGEPAAPTVEWSTVLTPNLDALWALHLEDADGITNRPVELPIKAMSDLPPVIILEVPVEDRLELRPVEKVALTYSVKEDIGLSAVQIRIRPQDQPEYLLPSEPLPDPVSDDTGFYRGTALLDLAKVLVPDGKEIRVCLMAADRLPAELQGPQRGYSREIVIRLNKRTKPQVEKNFEAQHDELRKKMEEVKRELQHAKGRMNDKPDRLRREDQISDNTLKDIESSSSHMQEAQVLLQELTERIKETAYARQAPELDNIAREMVQPAQEQTKDIPLTDEKEARAALAQQSKDLLENAIRTLEQEQRQMDQDRKAVQEIAKLSDIAEQQQRLAQEAAAAGAPENAAAPSADNAAPASAEAPANQASQTSPVSPAPQSEAATPGDTPSTEEQQRQWLEEQRRIAERAKQLMQENQNTNPQALQEQLKQAAAQAAQLAAEAGALAKQENSLALEIAAASTPESRPQQAATQQELSRQIAALQEKAKGFQEASAKAIDQSTETQEAAHQARNSLDEATTQALQSGEELAKAPPAPTSSEASSAESDEKGAAPDAASGQPENLPSGSKTATGEAPAPAPGTPESSQSAEATPPAAGTDSPSPASAEPAPNSQPNPPGAPAAQSGSPEAAPASETPAPAAGQEAAEASAQSLADAAVSLKSLGEELNSLAGMVAEHNKSLGEGAQQAGTAAEQAAQPQGQQGKGPSMEQGAKAAQQAADQLAMAANSAMQAMSIPANAKTSQASASSKGQGKPQDGQPNPSQPGQDGKDGLQMDTASSALPAELAKLGLTQDDWMKLRSSLNGVDGVSSEQIPAEYRDLVKAYFGALATGGNLPPSK